MCVCVHEPSQWRGVLQEGQSTESLGSFVGSFLLLCALTVCCGLQDYSVPRIDLFTEVNGLGRRSSYCDDTVEMGSYGLPQTTGSIKVHSGV